MADVDLVQIHFSAYMRWMDLSYVRLLAELRNPLPSILAAGGLTPVVDVHCSYLSPVGLGDLVEVTTWVDSHGHSSFVVRNEFRSDDREVAVGEVTHVWAVSTPSGASARRVPDWIAAATRPYADRPANRVPAYRGPRSKANPR